MDKLQRDALILVSGGARSGKSRLAQKLAFEIRGHKVTYLATGEAKDEEMKERILLHQKTRPSTWETVEEPIHILPVIQRELEKDRLILLDCMTLWLSNLLLQDSEKTEEALTKEVIEKLEHLIACQREKRGTIILVSNEVGMGVVPETPLGRIFRDVNGRMNAHLASAATKVYLSFFGLSLELKSLGGPTLS